MPEQLPRQPAQHVSDYDGAWKEALREHLSDFIRKYLPDEHTEIDWTLEPEWYDKKLSQILGQPGRRNQEVDVLVKVHLRNGQEQWILLHLEIQTSHEVNFPRRISLYNFGFQWVFKQRVISLVVLADLRKDWRPDEDIFQVGRFESRLKFPVCKLIDKLESEWQHDNSLPRASSSRSNRGVKNCGRCGSSIQGKMATGAQFV